MDTSEKLRSLSIDRGGPKPQGGAGAWPWIAGSSMAVTVVLALLLFWPKPPAAAIARDVVGQSTATTKPGGPDVATAAGASQPRGGLVASGYVVARTSATVSVDITGRLTAVLFDEGAVVKKGQLLAQLDDQLARYDLQLARARASSAKLNIDALEAQLIDSQAQRARAESLIQSQAVSRATLDSIVAATDALKARLAAAKADARVAEVGAQRQAEYVERHKVLAPFGGVIIAKNAQAGEILSPISGGGQFTRTGVATLVDMGSLEVEVDVNEGQIADVRAGQPATIVLDAYTDWEIPGEVIAIIPTANRDRATIQVRVGFKVQDPRILSQMVAKVTFDRSQ
jgi:HlyD family secretion protein